MIIRTVGFVRNIINKRKELVEVVKRYALADNVIVMTIQDNEFHAMGHTKDAATTLVMLGKAIAVNWPSTSLAHPDVELNTYLNQPANIALATINAELAKEQT